MNMLKYKIATCMAVLSIAPSWAQMDNVIDVEHVYKPEIVDANKVNVLPEVKDVPVKHYKVDYAKNILPVNSYSFTPVATDGEVQSIPAHKRFVTLGGGTEGNLLGRAAVGFDIDDKQSLDFGVGLSGNNADVAHYGGEGDDWTNRFYSTTASAKYKYRIGQASSLQIGASYESQVFNYQPEYMTGAWNDPSTDKQHNSIVGISAMLTPYSLGDLSVGAKVRYDMFSQKYVTNLADKYSEGVLDAGVTLGYRLNSSNWFDVCVDVTNASYSTDGVDGYTNLAVRPHYYWKGDNMDVKVGLYAGSLGIAPDISFAYHASPKFDVYADVTGGEGLRNTFSAISKQNPYWALYPGISSLDSEKLELKSQFNQLSARAGVKSCPMEGLEVDFNTGYELSKDRLEMAVGSGSHPNMYVPVFLADGNRFFVNLNAGYSYKDILTVRLTNQFNAWTIDDDNVLGAGDVLWRPVLDLDWSASVQVISGLRVGVGYRMQTFKEGGAMDYSRPTTSNLNANVSYTLRDMPLTVYVKGDNLLNSDYDRYFGYAAPGINVICGVAISF